MSNPTPQEINETLARFMGWEKFSVYRDWYIAGALPQYLVHEWSPYSDHNHTALVLEEIGNLGLGGEYIYQLDKLITPVNGLHSFAWVAAPCQDRALAAYNVVKALERESEGTEQAMAAYEVITSLERGTAARVVKGLE